MTGSAIGTQGGTAPVNAMPSAYIDANGNLQQVTAENPMPVSTVSTTSTTTTTSANVTKTDASGSISVANTSQLVIAADEDGFIWEMQAGSGNTSSIFIRDDGVEISDTAACLELQPGDNADSIRYGTQALYVYGGTSGDTFACKKIVRS